MPVYAIGDIHGRLDCLRELIDLSLPLEETDILVFMGDYVDRGPDSAGVIDFLLDLRERRTCIFLRGNHEEMFMHWMGMKTEEGYSSRAWFHQHGGRQTLESYGISTNGAMARWRLSRLQGRSDWLRPGHAPFLASTRMIYEDEYAYYVHAGFRPDCPPEHQEPIDLLTIRQGWIDRESQFDKRVIHGHTPTPYDGGQLEVRFLEYRINVDTGCGRHPRGFLSALRLPDLKVFTAGDDRKLPVQ